jgi:acetyl-CoA C-acetyltransferase
MSETYIYGYSRTPIGCFNGGLKTVSAPQLGASVIKSVLTKSGFDKNQIDEVIMGNVLSAGIGQAPSRQASIYAGLPYSTRCMTINKVCGSGLKAIMLADQSIKQGDTNIIIAGGMENMSLAPHYLLNSRQGLNFGDSKLKDAILHDGLWDPYNKMPMGGCAEILNEEENISRKDQDAFAIQSYERSNLAIKKGYFKNEIIPIEVTTKKNTMLIDTDEEPLKFNKDKILELRPVFKQDGSITAANASSINDGAAAVLVASGSVDSNINPSAKIIAHTSFAMDPIYFTKAPIFAIEKVLEKANISINDIDLFEINEAFSCVPLVAMRKLKISEDKINIYGGAVSLGHPIGASGARILVTLLNALENTKQKYGIACLCIGGGEASAMIVERINL